MALGRTDDPSLRAIVDGVEAKIGDQFFASLVEHLASALGVAWAFVSEVTQGGKAFRTRALWGFGTMRPNMEFFKSGTPCAGVLDGQIVHCPSDLQARFPDDVGLADWRVHSYCGVPLVDDGGRVVGHFAVFDDKPMPDAARALAVLRIFAARAVAEIERVAAERAVHDSEERLSGVVASAMDAIVTVDGERRVALFNAAAEATFGCPAAAAIGAPVDRFLTPAMLHAVDEVLVEGLGRRAPYVWVPEGATARRADGREFPIEGTISRSRAQGRPLCTLIVRDVGARQQAEEELRQLHRQNEYLREELKAVHNFDEIIGRSAALGAVLGKVALVAATDASVLILGETGTGKELVARAVHSGSPRRARPLIKVNCAALPAGLIESELFGHERGAFTGAGERRLGRFELARGGTIFLDEIGDMPLDVQAKLLRVLQEQEFERVGGSETIRTDVRVIAATNRDLGAASAAGTFRQDLYYRLNVFPVELPALRARPDDIPLLVHYFLGRFTAKIGRKVSRVAPETMRRLAAYAWPGNVRELENVIERAVILSSGAELDVAPELLPASPDPAAVPAPPSDRAARPPRTGGSSPALEDVERSHIAEVLERTGWRIDGPNGAAKVLGLNPSTLRSRIQRLGISRSRTAAS